MPDVGVVPDQQQAKAAAPRKRWVSPLLRRILLLNVLPPALLAAAMLYLDQYQNGLLAAEVEAMRTQARIYAGAIAEAGTRVQDDHAVLVPEAVRPLLRRLVDPSPNTQARLFDNTGLVVADSRVREGSGSAVVTEPLPPPEPRGAFSTTIAGLYDRLLTLLPRGSPSDVEVDINPDAPSFDWQPNLGPDRRRNCGWRWKGASPPISAAPRMAGCWSRSRNRPAAATSRSASCC